MTRPNKAFGQVAKEQDYAVEIDDTDSPYTTAGETKLFVDTSSGAVTVTLATADLAVGKEIRIVDDGENAGTNSITIDTEGSETFVPGGASSVSIDTDAASRTIEGRSSGWFADVNAEQDSVATEKIDTDVGGSGYSWQDVTASRSFDSWQTAPSDRDIWFVAVAQSTSDGTDINLSVNINTTQSGNTIWESNKTIANSNRWGTPSFRVPAGHDYKIDAFGDSANYDLDFWSELR